MDYCAPQWMDLACTSQSPSDDYFDREHEVHQPRTGNFTGSGTELDEDSKCIWSTPPTGKQVKDSGTTKKSPIWIISHSSKKNLVMKPTTYDNVLCEAMKNLELASKIRKTPKALNSSYSTISNSKTPAKASKRRLKSMGFHEREGNMSEKSNEINQEVYEDTCKSMERVIEESSNVTKPKMQTVSNTGSSSNIGSCSFFMKDKVSSKHTPRVLVGQKHRRSLVNHRRRSNKYVSLAEAVSKFHMDTPKRFRTLSTKESQMGPVPKVKQIARPTIPISPALLSKNRTRALAVPNQKKETEQNIAHSPQSNALKASGKKKPTASEPLDLTNSVKKQHRFSEVSQSGHRGRKTVAPTIVLTNLTGITVKNEEIPFFGIPLTANQKSTTRVMPFSFETRDKESQLKKEQKLKDLQNQESNKVETKSVKAPKKAVQMKKAVVPCPFSFEERDKHLAKKKEQLIKQALEDGKKARVFHANPVPSFKPRVVRHASKENLKPKVKNHDQENKEPNIKSNKEPERKIIQKKPIKPIVGNIELNTDVRAKQRKEFEEILKQKEIEEGTKRQEDERKKAEKQKLENAELRKQMEVKARPVLVYKPLVILKSSKPLTNPQSPAWTNQSEPRNDS